jgi:type IV secretory pathway TraG/TraD family ATPase VirD4
VLAILDEVAQIEPLKALTDAWAMAAGAAGLQLMAVYQDVSQMMMQMGKGFQTAVANSGLSVWFRVRDCETASFVSRKCGVAEVVSCSRNVSIDQRTGEPVISDGGVQTARPLLHPDEIEFGLQDDEMLLFCEGLPGVCCAKRKTYLKEFRCIYRDNPYFQKQGGGFLRWLFD